MESIGESFSKKHDIGLDVSLAFFTDGRLGLFGNGLDDILNIGRGVTLDTASGAEMAVAFDNFFG